MSLKKIIFFLCFSFLFVTPCKAITPTIEYEDGFYSNRIGLDQIYSGQMGFLVLDGKVVFCLDPYKIVGDNYEVNNSYFDNYSHEVLQYIKLVSIYVDDYIQNRNIYYYMAAQELIWEKMYGADTVFFTTEKNGAGSEIDLTDFKNEIELYVNNVLTKPSFEGTIIKDNFYTVVILEDTNNVLSQYDIINNSPNNVWINDNSLFVEILSSEFTNIKLVRREGSGDPIYYYGSTNQDLAYLNSSVLNVSEISVQANNEYNKNVVINFLDRENSSLISEAIHFEIVNLDNNKVIIDYETYNGMYYNNFTSGNYEIRIKDVPEGYLIPDSLNFGIEEAERLINCSVLIYFDKPIGRLNVNVFKENSKYQLYQKDRESDILISIFDGTKSFDLSLGSYFILDSSTNQKYEINLEYKDAITPIIVYDLDIYPEDNDNKIEEDNNDHGDVNQNNKDNQTESENQDNNPTDDSDSESSDKNDNLTNDNFLEFEDKDNNLTDNDWESDNIDDNIISDSNSESDNQEENDNLDNEKSTQEENNKDSEDDQTNTQENERPDEIEDEGKDNLKGDDDSNKEIINNLENMNKDLSLNNKNNIVDNLGNMETLPNTTNYMKTAKRYLFAILLLGLAIKFKKDEKK